MAAGNRAEKDELLASIFWSPFCRVSDPGLRMLVAGVPWTIVFLHGPESGPAGSKARYITHHFPGACVPDLEMSAWDPTKKNSAVRKFLQLQVTARPLDCTALSSLTVQGWARLAPPLPALPARRR